MDKVRIGIIGVGGIARGAHIPPLMASPTAEITAICDIDVARLDMIGDELNIPKSRRFTDYNDLVNCPEVDAVEICTPNNMHVPCAMAAVRAGKAVNVEKPLSIDSASAAPLMELLQVNPVVNMMCFSYRFKPAVQYARHILDKGMIGDIVSVGVEYLKDSAFWEGRRLDWRFDKAIAGTGVLGDLGAHLVDMARYLVGEFREVSADLGTIVKQRLKLDCDEYAPVTTDDYCHFIARLGEKGDIFANFTISRCCIGETNTIRYDIYGTRGMISFDLNDPDVLGVCVGEVDLATKSIHTVKVPPAFAAQQEKTFVDAVMGQATDILPDLKEGMAVQKILDALQRSAEERRWVTIN